MNIEDITTVDGFRQAGFHAQAQDNLVLEGEVDGKHYIVVLSDDGERVRSVLKRCEHAEILANSMASLGILD